jgi:membrane protein implicated in regulation of membrane protease activity
MDVISFLGFLALVIIGIAIILLIVRAIWMLIPAIIVAAIVFFLTFNLWYTGIAFLVMAILTVLFKILRKK